MAFFLIVPSVMIVSVLVVHALANRMGLKIYYGTLIAVALSAFAADFATVLVSPAVGKAFFLRLGIFVLAAAAILTAANIFFVKRKRAEEKNFNEEVRAAYRAEVEKTSAQAVDKPDDKPDDKTVDETPVELAPLEKFEWNESDAPSEAQTVEAETSAPETESTPAKVEAVEADDSESARPDEISAAETKSPEEFPLEEVFKPLETVKIEKLEKFAREEEKSHPAPEPKSSEVFPYEEVFKPLEAVKPDKIEKIQVDEKSSPHEKSPELEEKIETLDDILDRAYAERSKGHVWQAIDFYRKALERYRNDEYAPFVAIDLGNVYKEEALYSKAIKIYEEALTLPAVTRSASTQKEFAKNLEYLRAVRTVLLRHRALSTPFSKLTKELLREVDAELRNSAR
ncbi:MAG: hypothetical protein IJ774_01485 [Selenomonadaceae bacterium]|nr:hypothetical protein [Selenomonadaceae bacterium]